MPVFRSTARRRPLRAPARRRASTRWAPPGLLPSGVTLDLATFSDTFSETTLKSWWRDGAVIYPHPDRSAVITAGDGLSFNPSAGKYTEVFGTYPFDLTGDSVMFDTTIDPAMLTTPTVYIEMALMLWPLAFGTTAARVKFYHSAGNYLFEVSLDNGAVSNTFVVTSTVGWKYIKFTSNRITPSVVSIHRSPDGYVWTQVLSTTIASINITALTFYAWGSADY